jgi:hypothetical protein
MTQPSSPENSVFRALSFLLFPVNLLLDFGKTSAFVLILLAAGAALPFYVFFRSPSIRGDIIADLNSQPDRHVLTLNYGQPLGLTPFTTYENGQPVNIVPEYQDPMVVTQMHLSESWWSMNYVGWDDSLRLRWARMKSHDMYDAYARASTSLYRLQMALLENGVKADPVIPNAPVVNLVYLKDIVENQHIVNDTFGQTSHKSPPLLITGLCIEGHCKDEDLSLHPDRDMFWFDTKYTDGQEYAMDYLKRVESNDFWADAAEANGLTDPASVAAIVEAAKENRVQLANQFAPDEGPSKEYVFVAIGLLGDVPVLVFLWAKTAAST